jgi:hypothetical protein
VKITKEMYTKYTGEVPRKDDLERCNCPIQGNRGHSSCGWCFICNLPRFICYKHDRSDYHKVYYVVLKRGEELTFIGHALDRTQADLLVLNNSAGLKDCTLMIKQRSKVIAIIDFKTLAEYNEEKVSCSN